jgi:hypothetical protein
MELVTLNDYKEIIHSKEALHEALVRSGFYLPSKTSPVCSEDFLMKVMRGEIWLPRYEDIRLKPCPSPPTKAILIEKVNTAMLNRSP